jgi:hypothetical protein
VDKVYPRLKIIKNTCHCGAVNCLRLGGLPWRVYHIQFEGQLNPLMTFESRSYEAARSHAAGKVDNSLSRKQKLLVRSRGTEYYITAS